MASAVACFVFRTGLGAICLLAGLEKSRAPKEFVEGVRQYRLASRFGPLVGGGLIAAELLLGVPPQRSRPVFAAAGAIALFTAFAVALGVSLARSNTAPCHCFSNGREPAHQLLPEFAVDKVTLDQHKMITAGITFSWRWTSRRTLPGSWPGGRPAASPSSCSEQARSGPASS